MAFLTNLWAHLAAYGAGSAAIVVVAAFTWRGRRSGKATASADE